MATRNGSPELVLRTTGGCMKKAYNPEWKMNEYSDDCQCGDPDLDKHPHECPFKSEINDNNEACTCCDSCRHECAMDI